ncbi:PAS domain S-box protein [Desulfopila sp. IMCC35006]|uniref:PAS domain S-box protein n=1 Tax=Desulfopila sp. IMCC35006 TaxID=2569542 RepID=UPI0010ADA53C|nr:PAS domain S-box protein [Desulfopila sp. IMCC35006]TKB26266.1 PAS domain S-box protein [Desulfopila sp. IMCC35006]
MSKASKDPNFDRPQNLPAGILDAMHEPAAVMDENLCIQRAGLSFCHVLGRSLKETEGHTLSELGMGPTEVEKLQAMLALVLNPKARTAQQRAQTRIELSSCRKICISARLIDRQPEASPLILLTISDYSDGAEGTASPQDGWHLFRNLADAAFDGIAITQDGMFVDLSDRLAAMLGYQRDDLIGTPFLDCVASEHRGHLTGFMAHSEDDLYQSLMRHVDGTVFPVEIRPLLTEIDGRKTCILAIRDTSERKQYQKALELTQFTIDHASIGCTWIGKDGRFFYVNDQECRSLGYDRQELLQMSVMDIDPNFDSRVWADYWTLLLREKVRTFETIHRHKDGTSFPVEIQANYVKFHGRQYSCAFITDISERRKIELQLELTQFAIDRASFSCFWMEPEGRFFYVNDKACQSLGYSRQELLEKYGYDIDPDFTPEMCLKCWQDIVDQRVVTFETRHQHKNGTIFPVKITANYVNFGGKEYSCLFARDITESKRAEEELRLFQFSIDRASEAIFWMNREGGFAYVNDQACRSLHYSREELLSMRLWDIDPAFPAKRWSRHWQEMGTVGYRIIETTHRRRDGVVFPVEVSINHIRFGDREHHVAFVRDITERKQAEEERLKLESQLFQSQKLESIGRLAGGVAHDFNNMLGVILGYAELMKLNLIDGDPLRSDLMQIEKAALHSKDITAQLLAFSRKQVISPKIVDLNTLVITLQKTLARLIGEDVELQFFPAETLWKISFDPTQTEQILINLAANARDAMPNGGKLTIKTANIHLDKNFCRNHVDFIPGDFVQLSLSDNGLGMDKDTLSHVFEPFFTTKEVGKGTGLGLATVYGIVKQGGGLINVYSKPAQGTTFNIYFPRTTEEGQVETESSEAPADVGTETVLLVEDDNMVRDMTRAMLEEIGYDVLSVATPQEALTLLQDDSTSIQLLMTDVVMPKINGKELHDRAVTIRPNIKTLFMSGYTANVIVQHGMLDEGIHFIQKPFSLNNLARKIRNALL